MKDTVTNYRVDYECVGTSPSWGIAGAKQSIIFYLYDLKMFADSAPSNWQIRAITPIEMADR